MCLAGGLIAQNRLTPCYSFKHFDEKISSDFQVCGIASIFSVGSHK